MESSRRHLRDIVSQAMTGWRAGVAPDAKTVASSNPELLQSKSLLLDLAYEEYCLRLESGETIDNEEFCRGFPTIQSSLFRQIEVHRYLIQGGVAGPPQAIPSPGDDYLGFRIDEEIGRGAFSRVFLARQPECGGRRVVLKVASGSGQEAHALGRLDHPNIIPIYSTALDECSGANVVCMPLMGRSTLRDVLDEAYSDGITPKHSDVISRVAGQGRVSTRERAERPKPYVDEVVKLAIQLADALCYAHSRGVIHGDLKPSNVLISESGKPLLLDFNLATHENSLMIGGTLPYMAPEHVRAVFLAGADAIDERCDIFSFGVLLYELFCGKLPFGEFAPLPSLNDTIRAWDKQQRENFVPLPQANLAIDAAMASFIDRCLALDPSQRPATMKEVHDHLVRYASLRGRAARLAAKYRYRIAAGVVVCTAAIGISLAYIITMPPRSEFDLRRGKRHLSEGNAELALKHLQLATNSSEPTAEAFYWQGRARLAADDTLTAANDFEMAARMDRQGRYLAAWAYCLCDRGHFQASIAKSQAAIDAGYRCAPVYNNLGRAYFQWNSPQGHHSVDAWRCYTEAIRRDPTIIEPRVGRALIFIRCFQSGLDCEFAEEAVGDMRAAVRMAAPNGNLYFTAAMTLAIAARNKPSLAVECLELLELAAEYGISPVEARWESMEVFALIANHPRFLRVIESPSTRHQREVAPLEFLIVPE